MESKIVVKEILNICHMSLNIYLITSERTKIIITSELQENE